MSKWIYEDNDVEAIEVNGVRYVPERTCRLKVLTKEWPVPLVTKDGIKESRTTYLVKCSECGFSHFPNVNLSIYEDGSIEAELPPEDQYFYCPRCGAEIVE